MYRKDEYEKFLKEESNVESVVIDGVEVCMPGDNIKFSWWRDQAYYYHLQMRVVVKDADKDNVWHLTNFVPTGESGLCADCIISNYMADKNLQVVSFASEYKPVSQKLLEKATKSCSATEIKKAYDDIAAVEDMFNDNKIGYRRPMELIVDNETLEHIYVINNGVQITVRNITMAVCWLVPTDDMAKKALELIDNRMPVPNVIGMMPEDIADYAKHHGIKIDWDLSFCDNGDLAENGDFYGPYMILDSDNYMGYACRYTYDGTTFFWASGEHFNIHIPDAEKLHSKGSYANINIDKMDDKTVDGWLPMTKKVKSDEYGLFLSVE